MSFTPIPIDSLPDVTTTQESSARVAIEQNSVTFKATVRPNPPQEINVQSQAQLEAELGTDLEIADSTNVTIVVDASFTLDKPIKLGSGSSLEIIASVAGATITYTGNGALIRLTTAGVPALFFIADNFSLVGDNTNSFVDLEISSNGFVVLTAVTLSSLASIGTLDTPVLAANRFNGFGITQGLVIINGGAILMNDLVFSNFSTTNTTWFSFITNIISFVTMRDVVVSNSSSGDTLFFIDPNSPVGSLYALETSAISNGDFYQLGSDLAISSVVDSGFGTALFTTAAPHGFQEDQVVVLSAFATETTYNGTFIVSSVASTVFVVKSIPFTGDDTGNVNDTSLDSTDTLVLARGNLASPDSRFTGDSGLEVFGAEVTSSSLAQDVFEVVTSASWLSINLERFSDGVVNTGQLVCDDAKVRSYNISYSGTLEKSGGGSVDIGIIILKNGSNVAFNPPHTVNTGKIQISGADIVELTDTDTMDIAVINYDSTATAIDTSQLSLVVTKA